MHHPSWSLPTWALLGSLAAGCTGSHSHVTWSNVPPREVAPVVTRTPEERPPGAKEDPKGFVARFPNPAICEAAARRLRAESREEGWAALKACVELTPFTQMRALLSGPWTEDLRTRPEAASLIARVVAQRGGSVRGELQYLQEQKIPIFSLASAVDRPDTYKGRYVLLRAQVADQRSEGEKPTVWLVEHSLSSVETNMAVGPGESFDTMTTTSGDLGGQTQLTGPGQLGGSVSTREETFASTTRKHFDNISDETGREALGRLPNADPFLEARRDYVFLARFDGVRLTSGGSDDDSEAPRIPVLTIVSYHAPQELVVY